MRRRLAPLLLTTLLGGVAIAPVGAARSQQAAPATATTSAPQRASRGVSPYPASATSDPLTGPRSRLGRDWVGARSLPATTPILVLAGHADSQNISGSGTSGAAVAAGAAPMYPGISDELYWNMVVAQAVVAEGQRRGLRIQYYRPPFRTIHDEDAPGTNWTVGRQHVAGGGYAMEIHFDAWGPSGVGSGLIPPLHSSFTRLDEELAQEFGGYPMFFRDGLGGPRRGIALLEIGKLEGYLEAALRDPRTRPIAVQRIARRVVDALERGLGRPVGGSGGVAGRPTLTPPPGAPGKGPRGRGLQASSGGE
jgi:hypothetical protein